MTDPARLSLTAAAAHLAAGDLTARDLVDACLARISATAAHLGAFVAVDGEAARRAADGSDRRKVRIFITGDGRRRVDGALADAVAQHDIGVDG